MAFKHLVDLHTHTDNSFDGNHSVMFLCEVAYDRGLRAIAFTDHLEMDAFYRDQFDRTALQAYFEVAKAKAVFEGKLTVCNGAELGQAIYDRPTSETLLQKMQYDFVLGSIHNLPQMQDFYYMDFDDPAVDYPALLQQYFETELAMAAWGQFDSLAHLTYPLRYIVGNYHKPVEMRAYADVIDAILETLIKKDKALELNTAGLRQPIGVTSPDESILRRYRELGGQLLTVGSDAHFAADLGAGLEEGYELALRCGFECIALYQNRTPTLIPII